MVCLKQRFCSNQAEQNLNISLGPSLLAAVDWRSRWLTIYCLGKDLRVLWSVISSSHSLGFGMFLLG